MIDIICKKLVPEAQLPIHSTEMAAGYDLFTYEETTLQPGEYHLYKTGIAMAIPNGIYGRIAPRSGLAFKNGIDVLAGVIDADYRKEIGIILVNHGKEPWTPPKDEEGKLKPIAQMIFEHYNYANIFWKDELPKPESTRVGGFGSTDNVKSIPEGIVTRPVGPTIKDKNPGFSGGTSLLDRMKKLAGDASHQETYSEKMKRQMAEQENK